VDVVERYLLLGLRLGRHVDGLVDAYCGPPELARAVNAEDLVPAAELLAEATALEASIATAAGLDPARRGWLGDQAHGLRVYAGVVAGEPTSYADEVEGCYGVRPEPWPEDTYREAHAQLDELLPPGDTLTERFEGWRASSAVPADRMVPALVAAAAVLRTRTARIVELPEGERVDVQEVHDEPWWAFNYYLGGLRSRVVVNADTTTTAADIVTLAAHEVYPGHHTEHAVKEQRLIREQGRLEESIQLVPTPQAVVSEGIAEVGLDVLDDEELRDELEGALAAQGLEAGLEQAIAIGRARRPLRRVGLDVALLLHEHGASPAEAQAHYQRWALGDERRAAQAVRFASDPTWRAYAITYSAGVELCSAYVAGDPARLRTLLTEQVRVADLLAARQ
jgi:hypothetical protein